MCLLSALITLDRFIWVAGAAALLLASTGATGMAGATAHCPRGCISAYIAQMLLLLAFQARPVSVAFALEAHSTG